MSVRLLIVGSPGAGKGTQGGRIAKRFSIPVISTGDIFRQNITRGTQLGIQIKSIVDSGDYVPDVLTNELVSSRLTEDDALAGFLLDGYPRTPDQVSYLDSFLSARRCSLDAVLQLTADQDEIVRRLSQRQKEQGRADDSVAAIRHRQEVYARETAPVLDLFRARGLLIEVDGLGEVDEISERIWRAFDSVGIPVPVA